MPRFFRRLAEGVFDIEDLKFRTNELADFVKDASKAYDFDLERTIAIGYSNGANIGASMLLLRPEILSAAILFRAMVPLVPDILPDLSNKHIFMSSGLHDPIVPKARGRGAFWFIQECRCTCQMGSTFIGASVKWNIDINHSCNCSIFKWPIILYSKHTKKDLR